MRPSIIALLLSSGIAIEDCRLIEGGRHATENPLARCDSVCGIPFDFAANHNLRAKSGSARNTMCEHLFC